MTGMIMDRRDQVLMTFLEPASFCTTTLRSRCSSTKGPFLRLRGIFSTPTYASCRRCDDARCTCRFPCWRDGCDPQPDPKGKQGDVHRKSYLHHHHAGGQPGS